MKSFQIFSMLLFGIGITSFGLSFVISVDKAFSLELLKWGLTSIGLLSGGALQGVKILRKNKLLELEYSLDLVDHFETLQEFDKKIVAKLIDE